MTYVAQLFDICRTLHSPIFLHEVYFIGWFYKLALSDCGSIFRGQFVCERKSIAGYTTERTDKLYRKETAGWQNVTHDILLFVRR